MSDEAFKCPACGAPIATGDTFCEACGAQLQGAPAGATTPATLAPPSPSTPGLEGDDTGPIARTVITSVVCTQCGGKILDDGFCGTCGKKAVSPRDHWSEQPASWVGGVCDKGIVHAANEDAMALAALEDEPFAILVVCDGVTSAPHSDRAALAASRAACSYLTAQPRPEATGLAAVVSYWTEALQAAATEANAAAVGVAHTLGDPVEPPSCTFVAAVLDGDLVTVAWCGDSRAYWLPDTGEARQLSIDHSLGTEMMASGMSLAEAEADPGFHTITRWLGADSVDHRPEFASQTIDTAGWLLVCSDGLWNYASALDPMVALMARLAPTGTTDPVPIAASMVDFANAAGGHDNITAALARCDPSLRLQPGRTPGG